jgi:hypothetical protein
LLTFKPIWSTIELLAKTLEPYGVDLVYTLTQTGTNVFESSVVNMFTGIVAVQVAIIDMLKIMEVKPDGIIGHAIIRPLVAEGRRANKHGAVAVTYTLWNRHWSYRRTVKSLSPSQRWYVKDAQVLKGGF